MSAYFFAINFVIKYRGAALQRIIAMRHLLQIMVNQ